MNILKSLFSVVENNYKMRFIFVSIRNCIYLIIKNENKDTVKYTCFMMHNNDMIFPVKLNKKNK
ncbi:MAG TPA: hypothetical protein DIT05_00295 [Morganella sp. (in: Bacteria)]|nr:hypothetical protein [Morganella sp. (in: enterobacteria)]